MNATPIHCSSLPRLEACPASAEAPALKINSATDEAAIGTAVHEVLASWISVGRDDNQIDIAAQRNHVDEDEIRMLSGTGWRLWNEELLPWFPDAIVELPMQLQGALQLVGTADVVAFVSDGPAARVLDWKSGWSTEKSHDAQIKAYGWLACHQTSERPVKVSTCLVRLREKSIEWNHWTPDYLRDWWNALEERIAHDGHEYAPGAHCCFCPRAFECRARQQKLHDVGRFVLGEQNSVSVRDQILTDPGLVYDRLKLLQGEIEGALSCLKAEVKIRGGSWSREDEGELAIVTETRRALLPRVALPLLRETVGDGIMDAVRIGKTDAYALLRQASGKGRGAAAIRELEEKLIQLDGFEESIVEKLVSRKVVKNG